MHIGVISQPNLAMCKFCGEVIESLDHTLLLCTPNWIVWSEIMEWWGIKWVSPNSIDTLLYWWLGLKFKPKISMISVQKKKKKYDTEMHTSCSIMVTVESKK